MKKLLMFAMVLLCLMASAMAEESGVVVLRDDFSEGNQSVVPWNETTGTMEIRLEDGNAVLICVTNNGDEPNGYFHATLGPEVGDFDWSMRIRPDNIKNPDWNWLKLCFHSQPEHGENEAYILEIWDWRVAMSIKSQMNRRSEGSKLGENQEFWFDKDTWYDVRVEGRGNTYTMYIDNQLCLTLTDEDNLFARGGFALASWGVNFSIDDIQIVGYGEVETGE